MYSRSLDRHSDVTADPYTGEVVTVTLRQTRTQVKSVKPIDDSITLVKTLQGEARGKASGVHVLEEAGVKPSREITRVNKCIGLDWAHLRDSSKEGILIKRT